MRPESSETHDGEGAGAAEQPLLARQLTYLRRQRGWSQRELSRRTGIRQPEVSRIERGLIAPTAVTLVRLASALGYRVALLPDPHTSSDHMEIPSMNDAVWQGRIWSDPGKRSGQPLIGRTRITVRDVLEYLAGGMTPDEVVADFPELSLDDVQAALAYAAAHLEPMPA
jgi:uncharacterized protein (DUF433 family)/predicted XRE-type DNA-binding protein